MTWWPRIFTVRHESDSQWHCRTHDSSCWASTLCTHALSSHIVSFCFRFCFGQTAIEHIYFNILWFSSLVNPAVSDFWYIWSIYRKIDVNLRSTFMLPWGVTFVLIEGSCRSVWVHALLWAIFSPHSAPWQSGQISFQHFLCQEPDPAGHCGTPRVSVLKRKKLEQNPLRHTSRGSALW